MRIYEQIETKVVNYTLRPEQEDAIKRDFKI